MTQMKRPNLTKKEEYRVLQKFIETFHGESWPVCHLVMRKILKIKKWDGLNDLKKRYKNVNKS